MSSLQNGSTIQVLPFCKKIRVIVSVFNRFNHTFMSLCLYIIINSH